MLLILQQSNLNYFSLQEKKPNHGQYMSLFPTTVFTFTRLIPLHISLTLKKLNEKIKAFFHAYDLNHDLL